MGNHDQRPIKSSDKSESPIVGEFAGFWADFERRFGRQECDLQSDRIGHPSHFGFRGAHRVCPKETRCEFHVFQ